MAITVAHEPDAAVLYRAALQAGAGQRAARVQDMMLNAGLQSQLQAQRGRQQYGMMLANNQMDMVRQQQAQDFAQQEAQQRHQFNLDYLGAQQEYAQDQALFRHNLNYQQDAESGINGWLSSASQMNLTPEGQQEVERIKRKYQQIQEAYNSGMGPIDAQARSDALRMLQAEAAGVQLQQVQQPTLEEQISQNFAYMNRETGQLTPGLAPNGESQAWYDGSKWSFRAGEAPQAEEQIPQWRVDDYEDRLATWKSDRENLISHYMTTGVNGVQLDYAAAAKKAEEELGARPVDPRASTVLRGGADGQPTPGPSATPGPQAAPSDPAQLAADLFMEAQDRNAQMREVSGQGWVDELPAGMREEVDRAFAAYARGGATPEETVAIQEEAQKAVAYSYIRWNDYQADLRYIENVEDPREAEAWKVLSELSFKYGHYNAAPQSEWARRDRALDVVGGA